MSRPSPTTGSLTRGNGRGVTDFWPAASGAAPEAQYIPKRGGFWGVRHCRGQRTHRPRQSPVRMRGWGGVWLGRQVCHWARKSSPLKNADENCSLGKKSKAAEVRLKSYLHDLSSYRPAYASRGRPSVAGFHRRMSILCTDAHLLAVATGASRRSRPSEGGAAELMALGSTASPLARSHGGNSHIAHLREMEGGP